MTIETNSDTANMAEWERELLGLLDAGTNRGLNPDAVEYYQIPEYTIPETSRDLARAAFAKTNRKQDHGTRGQKSNYQNDNPDGIYVSVEQMKHSEGVPKRVLRLRQRYAGYDEAHDPNAEHITIQHDLIAETTEDTVELGSEYAGSSGSGYSAEEISKMRETALKTGLRAELEEHGEIPSLEDAGAWMRGADFANLSVSRTRERNQSLHDYYDADPDGDSADYVDGYSFTDKP